MLEVIGLGVRNALRMCAFSPLIFREASADAMHCGCGSMPMVRHPKYAPSTVHAPSFIPESIKKAPGLWHVARRIVVIASTMKGSLVPTHRTIARAPARSAMSSVGDTDGTRRCVASASHRLWEKHGEVALQSQPTHAHGMRLVSSSTGFVGRASSLLNEKKRTPFCVTSIRRESPITWASGSVTLVAVVLAAYLRVLVFRSLDGPPRQANFTEKGKLAHGGEPVARIPSALGDPNPEPNPNPNHNQARLSHASALTRAAVVNSLRFTLTEFASGATTPLDW